MNVRSTCANKTHTQITWKWQFFWLLMQQAQIFLVTPLLPESIWSYYCLCRNGDQIEWAQVVIHKILNSVDCLPETTKFSFFISLLLVNLIILLFLSHQETDWMGTSYNLQHLNKCILSSNNNQYPPGIPPVLSQSQFVLNIVSLAVGTRLNGYQSQFLESRKIWRFPKKVPTIPCFPAVFFRVSMQSFHCFSRIWEQIERAQVPFSRIWKKGGGTTKKTCCFSLLAKVDSIIFWLLSQLGFQLMGTNLGFQHIEKWGLFPNNNWIQFLFPNFCRGSMWSYHFLSRNGELIGWAQVVFGNIEEWGDMCTKHLNFLFNFFSESRCWHIICSLAFMYIYIYTLYI